MKEKKPPIIERICRAIDVLPESVSHTHCVEIHGRSLIKITDGGKILTYTHEIIRIALPHSKDVLTVTGKELTCAFYNMGTVGIEGTVDAVSFTDGERKE